MYKKTPDRDECQVRGDIDVRFSYIEQVCPEWLKKYFDEKTLTLVVSDFDVPDGETRWVRITREGGATRRFISPTSSYPEPENWEEV